MVHISSGAGQSFYSGYPNVKFGLVLRLAVHVNGNCVPSAVKMLHLWTAACQYVSYFVRRTKYQLCVLITDCTCNYSCVFMCKYYYVSMTIGVFFSGPRRWYLKRDAKRIVKGMVLISRRSVNCKLKVSNGEVHVSSKETCPACFQDDTSFGSNPSICFIFRRVRDRVFSQAIRM